MGQLDLLKAEAERMQWLRTHYVETILRQCFNSVQIPGNHMAKCIRLNTLIDREIRNGFSRERLPP